MFKDYGQLQNLLKEAQGLQEKMLKAQEDLSSKTTEGASGGGLVTVVVNGKQELLSVKIDPELLRGQDFEMIQDLVVAAVNQGLKNTKEMIQQEISKLTGQAGMNVPGLF